MNVIKKNFSYNLLFTVSNILFPIVSFPYASRIVGPEGIGKVQFITTFSQYFVLIASLGIPIYGIREIAKVKNDYSKLSKLFSELLVINFIGSIIFVIIYLLCICFIPYFQNDALYYIIAGIIVLGGFTTIDWFFSGIEEFRFISIRSIIIKFISLVALYSLVKTKDDLLLFFLITIFSIVSNNIWNLFNLKSKVSFTLTSLNLKKHLPVLFTLFSTSLATSIYTVIDTLFLGFLADHKAVGFYTAAIKLNKIAIPIIVSLGIVLIPSITHSFSLNDQNASLKKLADQSFSFTCLLGVPLAVSLYIFAPEIMLIFSGPLFNDAILTMQLASPLVLLVGLGHFFGLQLLIPSGNERGYLIAAIGGMFISLILNIFLIKLFNDKGAAIATVLGEVAVTSIAYYYVITKIKIKVDWLEGLKALAAALFFFPIAYVVRMFHFDPFTTLIIAFGICCISYLCVQMLLFKQSILYNLMLNFKN